jgi:lipopolysaccharide/colanic/teichoic acid biosynthesis glycosyltransferase
MENTSTHSHSSNKSKESTRWDTVLGRGLSNLAMRMLDISVAVLGLILLLPLFATIAFWVRRDSPGPVFYRGPRVGRLGEIFYILKFRTMYELDTSYAGPRVTAMDDPRVTRLGHWLRDTKLNELPQLWNVLVGEMSLVGPRPEDPELAKAWTEDVRRELLSVRPGITSPASVLYRNEEAMLSSGRLMENYLGSILPSKLRLDQLYVRNRSILLNLDTIFWTLLVLLPKVGASAPPEEQVFLGPLTRLMRRHVSWFTVDSLVTLGAIAVTGLLWRTMGPLNVGLPRAVGFALGFALLYSISNAVLGMNRINWRRASFSEALELAPAIGAATLAVLLVNGLWLERPMPVLMVILSAWMASVGFVIVRYRSRIISGLMIHWLHTSNAVSRAQERVLIVGGGESGQFFAWWLQNDPIGEAVRVVGYVDDDLYKQDTRIHGARVLGRCEQIPQFVSQYDIGVILFAIHNIPEAERRRLLNLCHSTPARLATPPDILGNLRNIAVVRGDRQDSPNLIQADQELTQHNLARADQLEAWLRELDDLAQHGDLDLILTRIADLRNQLQATTD